MALIRGLSRVIVVGGFAMCVGLLLAPSAHADLSPDCQASAVIAGKTYTPANDTKSNPVVIPDEEGLTAAWAGSTTSPITDHKGKIYVVVGPAKIKIKDWGSANKPKPKLTAEGIYSIDEARKDAFEVVGLYRVEGFHRGTGGSCDGYVMVKIEGSPLGTVPGLVSVGGTALAAIGLAAGAMARKVV